MDSNVAVVMGGSIAGLLTAKVLSPHFSKIIILDRDKLFDNEQPRKGTAQAAHAHILLKRGLDGLDNLLPGFTDELKQAGAVSTNATHDWQSLFQEGLLCRFKSDIEILCQSRHLLESTLRSFILNNTDNLKVIENAAITDVKFSDEHNPEIHYALNNDIHSLIPNLLVDCTGRYSKSPLNLKSEGFGDVPKLSISPYLGYSTRTFKKVSLDDGYYSTLIMAKAPDHTRGGVILPTENNQHIVTLFGFSKDYPPGDEQSYLDFAKSLRVSTVFDAIKNAEPTSEIKQFVKKDSHFYQYSKLKTWPQGFLVMGDAITSFNPIYGQGITTTISSAEILKKYIQQQSSLDTLNLKTLQRKICNNYNLPWLIAKNEDLRWPATEGGNANWLVKQMHHFLDMVGRASTKSKSVNYTYISVLHMIKLPIALLTPNMLYKIIRYGRKMPATKLQASDNENKINPLKAD